ncbi:MAG: hypothetical protein WCX48_11080 [Bacteroidales bacterium]
MAILDDVKVALRIAAATTEYDGEINDLISAAEDDLELAGVVTADATDPLTKRAIVTYCKSNFGYDNPDADRLQQAYLMLKMHLVLAEDYVCRTVTFTVTDGALVELDEVTISLDDLDITLTTNSQGVAIYKTTEVNFDLDYTVSKSGYVAVTSTVYVDGDETVGVVLNAA